MTPRLLLDTHVLVRWLVDSKRLSRDQTNALIEAVKRTEPIALSAIAILEISVLASQGKLVFRERLSEFFDHLRGNPIFRLFPLTYEIGLDVAALKVFRDPADRAIVATARSHRLTLVTSDQRIIESNAVPVIS